jgi:hypothetical protein
MKRTLIFLSVLSAICLAEIPLFPLPVSLTIESTCSAYIEDSYQNDKYTFVIIRLEGNVAGEPFNTFRSFAIELLSDASKVNLDHMQILVGEMRGSRPIHRVRLRFIGNAKGMMSLSMGDIKDPGNAVVVKLWDADSDPRPLAKTISDAKAYPMPAGYVGQLMQAQMVDLPTGSILCIMDGDTVLWQQQDGKFHNLPVRWGQDGSGRVVAVREEDLAMAEAQERVSGWEIAGVLGELFELESGKPMSQGWRKGTRLADLGDIKDFQGGKWAHVRDPLGVEGYIYIGTDEEPALIRR